MIALVLARDSLGDGLGAFEAAGSIEIRTLAAGVEFEAALGTLPNRFGDRSQQSAALRAAGNGVGSGHLQSARSEGFLLDRLFAGRLLPVFICIRASVSVAVLIAVLAILLGHAHSSAANGYCLASLETPQVRWETVNEMPVDPDLASRGVRHLGVQWGLFELKKENCV